MTDWYAFKGVLLTDRGTHIEICVTDLGADDRGIKDQVGAEDLGFVDVAVVVKPSLKKRRTSVCGEES